MLNCLFVSLGNHYCVCCKGEVEASSLKAGTVVEDEGLVSSLWVPEGDVECECVCNGDEEDDGGVFSVGKTRDDIGTNGTSVRDTGGDMVSGRHGWLVVELSSHECVPCGVT